MNILVNIVLRVLRYPGRLQNRLASFETGQLGLKRANDFKSVPNIYTEIWEAAVGEVLDSSPPVLITLLAKVFFDDSILYLLVGQSDSL